MVVSGLRVMCVCYMSSEQVHKMSLQVAVRSQAVVRQPLASVS